MAGKIVARERLVALRQIIAGIEGRLAERLVLPMDMRDRSMAKTASAGIVEQGDAREAVNSYALLEDHAVEVTHDTNTRQEDMAISSVLLRHGGVASSPVFSTGASGFDTAVGGGLPAASLIEIHGRETRDSGAVAGFALALAIRASNEKLSGLHSAYEQLQRPLLWVGTAETFSEAGFPYAPGLAGNYGLNAQDLLFVEARRVADAAWIADEAARLDVFSAVLLELRGNPKTIGLTATRRLNRRAQIAGRPVFLLRQAGLAEATAAPVRFVVSPAPATERTTVRGPLSGSIGPPGFLVTVSKNRAVPECSFTLVWNRNGRSFEERKDIGTVVSASGNRPAVAATSGPVVAFRQKTG